MDSHAFDTTVESVPPPVCSCGAACVEQVTKDFKPDGTVNPNAGKHYWSCATRKCRYFQWVDEPPKYSSFVPASALVGLPKASTNVAPPPNKQPATIHEAAAQFASGKKPMAPMNVMAEINALKAGLASMENRLASVITSQTSQSLITEIQGVAKAVEVSKEVIRLHMDSVSNLLSLRIANLERMIAGEAMETFGEEDDDFVVPDDNDEEVKPRKSKFINDEAEEQPRPKKKKAKKIVAVTNESELRQ